MLSWISAMLPFRRWTESRRPKSQRLVRRIKLGVPTLSEELNAAQQLMTKNLPLPPRKKELTMERRAKNGRCEQNLFVGASTSGQSGDQSLHGSRPYHGGTR